MFLLVNHDSATLESSSSRLNLNPIFHAISKPCQTATSSAILFDASPKLSENPEIHPPELSHNILPAPTIPGLPIALPSIFSLI